jgi:hypothetical protein
MSVKTLSTDSMAPLPMTQAVAVSGWTGRACMCGTRKHVNGILWHTCGLCKTSSVVCHCSSRQMHCAQDFCVKRWYSEVYG